MMFVVWYLKFTFIVQIMWPLCDTSSEGDSISKRLDEDIANSIMGVKEYQDYMDNGVTFKDIPLNVDDLAKKIATAFSDRLQPNIDSLKTMKSKVETLYRSSSISNHNPYQKCCTMALRERSARLANEKVNLTVWCAVGEKGLKDAKEFLPISIMNTVKEEYNKAVSALYLYFASHEGVLWTYPGMKICSTTYDPRFRPWYVKTSTPNPKDLVVVIDKSGSMDVPAENDDEGRTLMAIAKNASITVMDTLNPNDQIGIVDFSTEAHVPPGNQLTSTCYSTKLAKATPENKKYLREYINNIQPNGATYYSKALKKAFQYFINTPDKTIYARARDKVILFLTDGEPSEKNISLIHNIIAEQNAKLKNNVVILTYGLSLSDDIEILEEMASQKYHNPAYGKPKKGIYKSVMDVSTLYSAMGTYYELFSESQSSGVTFSDPYMGAFGAFSGLLITLCLPIFNKEKFTGATCMDVSMNSILQDLVYFDGYQSSYGFIIDKQSRLISHPMLQPPAETTNTVEYVYLKTLESSLEDDVIERMVSGKTGSETVSSRRILARGNVTLEGTKISITKSTYSWYPVDGTNFTLCMVVAMGDHIISNKWNTKFPNFLYHKLDLSPQKLKTCNYFSNLALLGKGASISFAPGCFVDPYKYLHLRETRETVQSFYSYLEGDASVRNPGFKSGIKETVAIMAKFDSIMKARMKLKFITVWQYLASRNGIMKTYPAAEEPVKYDARTRPWFHRAKSFQGLLVISTPYTDFFSNSTVTTISKAITKKISGGQTDFLGVIGIDISLSYFYNTIIGSEQICQTHSCFMIDKAGYIVAHRDWIASPKRKPRIESVHISLYEPYIASKLFSENAIKHAKCINTQLTRYQYVTKVTQDKDIINSNFELHIIKDTNVYLIVKIIEGKQTFCSSCFDTYGSCIDFNKSKCFCPCHQPVNEVYEYCSAKFRKFSDTVQPCPPVNTPLTLFEIFITDDNSESTVVEALPQCINYECDASSKNISNLCNNIVTCSWCQFNRTGMPMEQPYCSTEDVCPFGSLANSDRESTTKIISPETGTSAPGWLIPVVIFVPLVLLATAAAIFFRKNKADDMSMVSTGLPRPSLPRPSLPTQSKQSSTQSRHSRDFYSVASINIPDFDQDPDSEPKPKSKSKLNTEANPESKPDVNSQAERESNTETKQKSKPKLNPESNPELSPEPKPKSKSKLNLESKSKSKAKLNLESKSKSKAKVNLESKSKSKPKL